MDYIITIIGPFGGIVYSDSGKTDIGGLSYKHLTGFRDSGIYRVVFEVDEVDDVVESCEFIVLDVGLTYTTTSTTQTTSTSTSTTRTTLTSTSTSILSTLITSTSTSSETTLSLTTVSSITLSSVVVLDVDVVNDSFVELFDLSRDSVVGVFDGLVHPSRGWSDGVSVSVFFCLEAMNYSDVGSAYVVGLDSSDPRWAPVLSKRVGGFQRADGSFNGSVGLTGFGLYRLVNSGDGVLVNRSIDWLVSRQGFDGGWAQTGFNGSSFYPTSHAVGALVYADVNGFDVDDSVLASGVSYLLDEVYSDGVWLSYGGSGDYSASHKVCEVLLVLLYWDPHNPLIESGVGEVKGRRLSDGSWGHQPSHTAVCSWMLHEYQKVSS